MWNRACCPIYPKLLLGHPCCVQASEIQVGTHVLQALCGDAKFRKDTRVTDKVPAVKRAVERFTILVRDLLQGASWCSVP
jgi:hypothetical protein